MSTLKILAPCSGWCCALDEVPDAVFAGRMLGDGLAIDPTSNNLLAPCAGEVVTLPASAHAVSIRTPQGVEVLIHIGIDTVALAGRGFEARVQAGSAVQAGDELIRFDLNVVARGAKSLLTPIVITSMDGLGIRQRRTAGAVTAGEVLFEVTGFAAMPQPSSLTAAAVRKSLKVALHQGLHARPAAVLAQRAKSFDAQTILSAHGRHANARSVVAIMGLGVHQGDELVIEASGAAAAQAVEGILAALEQALRTESVANHGATPTLRTTTSSAMPIAADPTRLRTNPTGAAGVLTGVVAVAGCAVGRVARIERREVAVQEQGAGTALENVNLARAKAEVRVRLERVAEIGGNGRRDIIATHLEFLEDPLVNEAAVAVIEAGKSAGFAWRSAIQTSIAVLQSLDDPRLRERVDDLKDVQYHVLLALAGETRPMIIPLPERAILVADDLLPSELTALDRQRLIAVCLGEGGATSHVAILAAALGTPMLVGLGTRIRDVAVGATVIVDADMGRLLIEPTAAQIEHARAQMDARLANRTADRTAAQVECRSLDGTRIEVFANLGNAADAAAALECGAEGCGLLRTEFLFIDRQTAPGEDEQLAAYQTIADTLGLRPMVLRLMDVGGDKPLRYLPLPAEANPALGLRGVRTALACRDLLRTQLRAALRVQPAGQVRLLIPMITDAAEILAVRAIVDDLVVELRTNGRADPARIDVARVELGAMIETPAAALIADALLREVDFLSIGSNDLTQYTLAMDRGHPQLAHRTDALHPAVLKLIAAATAAGTAAGKMVAICGAAAADRCAVPVLLGLGVRELSVVPASVPAVKRQVRGLRLEACRALAARCLLLASAEAVRAEIERTIKSWGVS